MNISTIEPQNYFACLDEIKRRIRSSQVKASLAVNQELVTKNGVKPLVLTMGI